MFQGDTWFFLNMKRLEYFTGTEVYSVTQWTQLKMHIGVNFYHTSEIGEKRNLIKKKQAALTQLALVFEVMINIIHITCISKICL